MTEPDGNIFTGKCTLESILSRELHSRRHLTYVLDGDNLRHGLNRDLSIKAEDHAENIRIVGEVAKLFADAGLIYIACLISPFRSDRDASEIGSTQLKGSMLKGLTDSCLVVRVATTQLKGPTDSGLLVVRVVTSQASQSHRSPFRGNGRGGDRR
ncbi:hypothetical protein EJB05_09166, partial [Eragrostis curvula]